MPYIGHLSYNGHLACNAHLAIMRKGTMTVAFEHIMTWPDGMYSDADYPYRDAQCVRYRRTLSMSPRLLIIAL